MIIDSHCHIAHMVPADEQAAHIERAHAAGVDRMITLATSLDNAPQHLALAQTHPSVFACCGIHPSNVHQAPDAFDAALEALARDPQCVAIGETGLDYYHPAPEGWTDEAFRARQADFLRRHFELAARLHKSIVIHTRDRKGQQSLDDALSIYAEYAEQVQAVFHCFIYPAAELPRILELGGLASFTGIATFKSATDCLEAAVNCPAGSMMVETDAPFLTPMPHRGKRSEPAHTRLTAAHIAAARGESLDHFAAHTTAAAKAFFRLP